MSHTGAPASSALDATPSAPMEAVVCDRNATADTTRATSTAKPSWPMPRKAREKMVATAHAGSSCEDGASFFTGTGADTVSCGHSKGVGKEGTRTASVVAVQDDGSEIGHALGGANVGNDEGKLGILKPSTGAVSDDQARRVGQNMITWRQPLEPVGSVRAAAASCATSQRENQPNDEQIGALDGALTIALEG